MKYIWKCDHCNTIATKAEDLVCDAARAGILANPGHANNVYVTTEKGKYIGRAEGLLFNGVQHPSK